MEGQPMSSYWEGCLELSNGLFAPILCTVRNGVDQEEMEHCRQVCSWSYTCLKKPVKSVFKS